MRLEQLDRSRRCERDQKGSCAIDLSCLRADAGCEDDVALQMRRQPPDELDTGYIKDGGDTDYDETGLTTRDRLDCTA